MLSKNKMTRQTMGSMLLTSFTLLLAVMALFGPLTNVALAKQNKVSICHLTGNGDYNLISVAEPALEAHLSHGDLVVGVEVDENCEPLATDTDNDGVADAEDNCLNIANPGQEDRYGTAAGDACEDLDGDGTLDVNETNFCLSIDGVLLEQRGTAECESTVPTGQGSNVAVANGDGAKAEAAVGDSNSATATGDGAQAFAIEGDNNSATATGNNVFVGAGFGNNNSAAATGDGAYAVASLGDNNSATATGDGAEVVAQSGNNNSATATGDGAYARAAGGDNNSATATGDGAEAVASVGDNNSATSTGVFTCAGGGDSNETAVNEDLCN